MTEKRETDSYQVHDFQEGVLKLAYFIHLPWLIGLALVDGRDKTGILIFLTSLALVGLVLKKAEWICARINAWEDRKRSARAAKYEAELERMRQRREEKK